MNAVAPGRSAAISRHPHRWPAILAAVTAATVAWAVAEALQAARLGDAFMVAPGPERVGAYLAALALLSGLAVALDLGGPPLSARGGRAARQCRALLRRRFRHGRSRADIANVETGLTISFCAMLAAAMIVFVSAKALLAVVIVAAFVVNAQAFLAICRLAGFAPRRAAPMGFLYGLLAGWFLT